jgi:hypothetical protein
MASFLAIWVGFAKILRIDTLCLEGIYPQKVVGFSQPIFELKNIPQVEHLIVSGGLNLILQEGHRRPDEHD